MSFLKVGYEWRGTSPLLHLAHPVYPAQNVYSNPAILQSSDKINYATLRVDFAIARAHSHLIIYQVPTLCHVLGAGDLAVKETDIVPALK